LRDRLVEGAGFEKADAWQFVTAANESQAALALPPSRRPVMAPVAGTVLWEQSQQALREAVQQTRAGAIQIFQTPREQGVAFRVPQIAVRVHGELQLFDDPEVLDYPWDLPRYAALPSAEEIARFQATDRLADAGTIDIQAGQVVVGFLPELARDLDLVYVPEHWTEARLAAWLCRNLRETYITQSSMMVFVSEFLSGLLRIGGMDLARANRQKFLLRALLEGKIREIRRKTVGAAYQQFLFTDGVRERALVGGGFEFEFHPDGYAPSRDYPRAGEFQKHYYPRCGAFDSDEEEACAWELERLAQRGDLEFWVRNLVRKPTCSFFLPSPEGRFYPDFLCWLPGGELLAVEYKGADRWADAQPDRRIGAMWEELSGGRCRFVMLKEKRWEWIPDNLRQR